MYLKSLGTFETLIQRNNKFFPEYFIEIVQSLL